MPRQHPSNPTRVKPATFADMGRADCEERPYTVRGFHSEHGRSSAVIECPFCQGTTRAWVWSLAGSGKRCSDPTCGALFGSMRTAYRMKRAEQTP